MSAPREIELKLELDPVQPSARKRRLPAGLPGQGRAIHLRSRIFDTPDHALQQRGYVLRLRHDGARTIQTLKAPGRGGLLDRLEWEQEIAGERPVLAAIPDAEIRETIAGFGALDVVLETEFERVLWSIRRDGSDLEMVFDQGEIRAGGQSLPIREIEIELKSGSLAALFGLAREVAERIPVRIGVASKSERGYRLLSPLKGPLKSKGPMLAPDMNTAQAFQTVARTCLLQFRRHEPGIARREPESLHQGRVAIRRLRSAFKLFRPVIGGDEAERLAHALRLLFRALGEARNLDVYLGRTLSREEEIHPDEPGLAELQGRIRRDREAVYDRILRRLAGRRHRHLMLDLLAFCEAGDWLRDDLRSELRADPVADFARRLLAKRWRRMKKRGKHLASQDAETRHQLRIDGKVLRYAAEFFGGAFPGRKAKARQHDFLEALEDLQSHLGDLNDIETGHAIAEKLARDAAAEPVTLMAAGHADGREEARESELLQKSAEAVKRLGKAEPFWD